MYAGVARHFERKDLVVGLLTVHGRREHDAHMQAAAWVDGPLAGLTPEEVPVPGLAALDGLADGPLTRDLAVVVQLQGGDHGVACLHHPKVQDLLGHCHIWDLHICPQGQKHRRATFDRQRQQQLQRAQLHGRFARLQRHRHLHTCDRLIGVGGQLRHSFRLSLEAMRLQHIAIKAEGHRLGAKVVDAEAAHDFGAALDHVPKVQHVVGGSQLATHGLILAELVRLVGAVHPVPLPLLQHRNTPGSHIVLWRGPRHLHLTICPTLFGPHICTLPRLSPGPIEQGASQRRRVL
mmetsp:Transcript_164/g.368  ORF Transcript_164/g.368 Transcript_164/m.368 type:complete len:292 (-) Transcript_164:1851-2726(-)